MAVNATMHTVTILFISNSCWFKVSRSYRIVAVYNDTYYYAGIVPTDRSSEVNLCCSLSVIGNVNYQNIHTTGVFELSSASLAMGKIYPLRFRGDGKNNHESGADVQFALDAQVAAHGLDEALAYGEAEALALFAFRAERQPGPTGNE